MGIKYVYNPNIDNLDAIETNALTLNGSSASQFMPLSDREAVNTMLNAWRIVRNGSMSYVKMDKGFVDGFKNQTGVNTGSSINQIYVSNSYYHPSSSAGSVLTVDALIVGGGGGGNQIGAGAGGGGALYVSGHTVDIGSYAVVVGAGGTAVSYPTTPNNGGDSSFDSLIGYGGGAAIAYLAAVRGKDGGCGGGGCSDPTGTLGGSGVVGQGFPGGAGATRNGNFVLQGGGGGAGAPGLDAVYDTSGGDGGSGLSCDITGSVVYYGGGGGASIYTDGIAGIGGVGGGGNGAVFGGTPGTNGTDGLGGGAGGLDNGVGGTGGSGVVIIRYNSADLAAIGGVIANTGSAKVHTFTTNDNFNIVDIATDLVAHYKMNDNAASTTVVDNIGGINGTAQQNTSSLTTTGKINNALSFNGSSDYVETADVPAFHFGDGDFAISFWTYMNSVTGEFIRIGNYGMPGELRLFIENSKFKITLKSSTGAIADEFADGNVLSADTWYHYVLTRNGSNFTLYQDGTSIWTKTDARALLDEDTGLFMGWGDAYLNGKLDDVRVYDKSLSSIQVEAIYSNGLGTEQDTAPAGGGGGVNNMTLISNKVYSTFNPTKARIMILQDNTSGLSINDEIQGFVSTNGSDYNKITLTDNGFYESNKRILTGENTISGTAGSQINWKVETSGNKYCDIYGVGVLWS